MILGVQGVSAQHAAKFSRRANDVGADGVIAMAPYVQELEDEEAVIRYYQAIDREVNVPIQAGNRGCRSPGCMRPKRECGARE